MKNTLIFLFVNLLFTNSLLGQANQSDFVRFEKSFITYLCYPKQLKDRCIPTLTYLKVNFDDSDAGLQYEFSDSAFPQFIDAFKAIEEKLDFASLRLYFKQNNIRTGLILIHYDTSEQGRCESQILLADVQDLFRFSGNDQTGIVSFCPKIYLRRMTGPTFN